MYAMRKLEKVFEQLTKVANKTSPYVTGGIWLLFGYANVLGAYMCHKMGVYSLSYSIVAVVCVVWSHKVTKWVMKKKHTFLD